MSFSSQICKKITDGWTEAYDEEGKVPYAYSLKGRHTKVEIQRQAYKSRHRHTKVGIQKQASFLDRFRRHAKAIFTYDGSSPSIQNAIFMCQTKNSTYPIHLLKSYYISMCVHIFRSCYINLQAKNCNIKKFQ